MGAAALCPIQIENSRQHIIDSTEQTTSKCLGYGGPSGACYAGPGGGLYAGPGGGLYAGPGGGMYAGPGGGLYAGPGGGMYAGPGGGIYGGPPSNDQGSYKGPWGPCITGAAKNEWLRANCQNHR